MIDELRASLRQRWLDNAEKTFFTAKGRLTFWWTVFAISSILALLNKVLLKNILGRPLQYGFTLLAVVSFFLGCIAILRWRGAKAGLDRTRTTGSEEPVNPESGQE
jgi:hypothetical protein